MKLKKKLQKKPYKNLESTRLICKTCDPDHETRTTSLKKNKIIKLNPPINLILKKRVKKYYYSNE